MDSLRKKVAKVVADHRKEEPRKRSLLRKGIRFGPTRAKRRGRG